MLRLLEHFPENQVRAAVEDAARRRLIGFDAVKHLLLARIEKRPAHLDLSRYPPGTSIEWAPATRGRTRHASFSVISPGLAVGTERHWGHAVTFVMPPRPDTARAS